MTIWEINGAHSPPNSERAMKSRTRGAAQPQLKEYCIAEINLESYTMQVLYLKFTLTGAFKCAQRPLRVRRN